MFENKSQFPPGLALTQEDIEICRTLQARTPAFQVTQYDGSRASAQVRLTWYGKAGSPQQSQQAMSDTLRATVDLTALAAKVVALADRHPGLFEEQREVPGQTSFGCSCDNYVCLCDIRGVDS